MSETGKENNKKLSALETAITLPAKYVMSVIGVVLSISGFVALVTTQSVKSWVKGHPYPIYLALIVAVLVVAGTLDYAYNMRKRIKLPSGHDKKLYRAALGILPVNGSVVGWLKNTEMADTSVADFPADVLGTLEQMIEFSERQPVGFDDARLARSFESLIKTTTDFRHAVDRWTSATRVGRLKGIMAPPPGTSGLGEALSGRSRPPVSRRFIDAGSEEASTVLAHRHRELVSAYDDFLRTAHGRGIDIDE